MFCKSLFGTGGCEGAGRRPFSLLPALLAICLLCGCAAPGGGEPPGSGTQSGTGRESAGRTGELTDMIGRPIALDAPVTRAVVITAADCEIIYALGAEEVLVGRGEYCDYPEAVSAVPSVQSGENLNIEQIIALGPQIVFISTMAQSEEQTAALESAGIAVINTEATDIAGTYAAIAMIGAVLDRQAQAAALVSEMQSRFAAVSEKVPEADEPVTVYFEVAPLEWGLWTAGQGTFMHEIAGLLGMRNVFSDVSGWGEVSQEQVIGRNPDYILTVTMYLGGDVPPCDEILSRSGWQDIRAIQQGHVYSLDSDEFSRPGPRLADAAEHLYELIYG